jgi:hypothetical protein
MNSLVGLRGMDISGFLKRLIEIRRAVSVKEAPTVRHMVGDAQDPVMESQKQQASNAPVELRTTNAPR